MYIYIYRYTVYCILDIYIYLYLVYTYACRQGGREGDAGEGVLNYLQSPGTQEAVAIERPNFGDHVIHLL